MIRSGFLCGLLALAACSSNSRSGNPTTAATSSLQGTYTAASTGAIATLQFPDAKHYVLVREGCANESCTESGTYSLESAGADSLNPTLALTNGVNGETSEWPLRIVSAEDESTAPNSARIEAVSLFAATQIIQRFETQGQVVQLIDPGGGCHADYPMSRCLVGTNCGGLWSGYQYTYGGTCDTPGYFCCAPSIFPGR